MADKQILVTGSADAPEGYTVPNAAQIIPKAVSAVFDGTGASGNFIPVLEVVSDGGVVVAQSPASQVSAGGQAEVSWFPRVGAQAAAVGLTSLPICQGSKGVASTQTFGAGVTDSIVWTDAQITDASVYSWDSGNPAVIHVLQSGIYQWWVTLSPDTGMDWPAAGTGNIHFAYEITTGGGAQPVPTVREVFAQYPQVSYETGQTVNDETNVTAMGVTNIENVPNVTDFFVTNNTASSWRMAGTDFFYIVRLGPSVTPA